MNRSRHYIRLTALPACSLAALVATARPVWSVMPISYSGTVSGQTVTFTGQRDIASVTGSVTVAGATVSVTGTLAVNGSVSGTVALPNGTRIGTFSAQPSSSGNLTVTYSVDGTSGTLTAPVPTGLLPQ